MQIHRRSGLPRRHMMYWQHHIWSHKHGILSRPGVGGQTSRVHQCLMWARNGPARIKGHSLGQRHPLIMYWDPVQIHHRTRGTVCLELGLVRLQHSDLSPAVKEECNGAHPHEEYDEHYQHLLRVHDYFGTSCCGRVKEEGTVGLV